MQSTIEEQRLLEAVSTLYARFAAGRIRPSDLTDAIEPGRSARSWMADAIASRANYQPDAIVFVHFQAADGAIVDVGSHWGYTALAMRLSGTDCPIISIEASAMHTDCLDEFRHWDRNYDFTIQALGAATERHVLYTPVVNGTHVTGLTTVDGSTFDDHHARQPCRRSHTRCGRISCAVRATGHDGPTPGRCARRPVIRSSDR